MGFTRIRPMIRRRRGNGGLADDRQQSMIPLRWSMIDINGWVERVNEWVERVGDWLANGGG
jgi:hypothetical protein